MSDYISQLQLLDNGTFLHWLAAVGITLLVLDVFFNTEFLSWISIAIFASWGTWLIGAPVQWSVLVFIILTAIGFGIYYALWVRFVRPFIYWLIRIISGSNEPPPDDNLAYAGRNGTVVGEGESLSVKVQDELFPIAEECREGFSAGDKVVITEFKGGVATVERRG